MVHKPGSDIRPILVKRLAAPTPSLQTPYSFSSHTNPARRTSKPHSFITTTFFRLQTSVPSPSNVRSSTAVEGVVETVGRLSESQLHPPQNPQTFPITVSSPSAISASREARPSKPAVHLSSSFPPDESGKPAGYRQHVVSRLDLATAAPLSTNRADNQQSSPSRSFEPSPSPSPSPAPSSSYSSPFISNFAPIFASQVLADGPLALPQVTPSTTRPPSPVGSLSIQIITRSSSSASTSMSLGRPPPPGSREASPRANRVIGSTIGGLVAFVCLIALLVFFLRCRRLRRRRPQHEGPPTLTLPEGLSRFSLNAGDFLSNIGARGSTHTHGPAASLAHDASSTSILVNRSIIAPPPPPPPPLPPLPPPATNYSRPVPSSPRSAPRLQRDGPHPAEIGRRFSTFIRPRHQREISTAPLPPAPQVPAIKRKPVGSHALTLPSHTTPLAPHVPTSEMNLIPGSSEHYPNPGMTLLPPAPIQPRRLNSSIPLANDPSSSNSQQPSSSYQLLTLPEQNSHTLTPSSSLFNIRQHADPNAMKHSSSSNSRSSLQSQRNGRSSWPSPSQTKNQSSTPAQMQHLGSLPEHSVPPRPRDRSSVLGYSSNRPSFIPLTPTSTAPSSPAAPSVYDAQGRRRRSDPFDLFV